MKRMFRLRGPCSLVRSRADSGAKPAKARRARKTPRENRRMVTPARRVPRAFTGGDDTSGRTRAPRRPRTVAESLEEQIPNGTYARDVAERPVRHEEQLVHRPLGGRRAERSAHLEGDETVVLHARLRKERDAGARRDH